MEDAVKFYSSETLVKQAPEVEDANTGLRLPVMRSVHAIGEDLFQDYMHRKRIVSEHLLTRKTGQRGWCITLHFAHNQRPENVIFFAEVDEKKQQGTLLGWAPWISVQEWPYFEYGSKGSIVALAPKDAIQDLSAYQEAL